MVVSVRLFAMLREAARRDQLDVELADGATAGDLVDAVARDAGLGAVVQPGRVVVAVNREYVPAGHPLQDGDEVALIPPVSGGADADVHARVSSEPLDLGALATRVGRPAAGAVVTFSGTTRDVERLDYEAYAEMAQERIAAILTACVERHGLQAAAAEHRIGAVPRGEASVVVAVSAGHRAEAFAGAREAIDRIKAETPIWKKEIESGRGGNWVEGTLPAG
ncbi:MAG TPA: molybdopterin converting factor subunit 1 [Solirubrobacteraceae bacterium]|jgi:molybdopterin synthase catalytic subunit|nr:molybdopterin converting factor subunit 1 [Solirubrobacteraceae bacterium]